MIIKLFFLITLLLQIAFAIPRFALENGTGCAACHVSPTGGGMRNDYGNNVVALDELPLKRWQKSGSEDWDGFITDLLMIGGDFRIQGLSYSDTDSTTKSVVFPMQADVHTNLKINKKASLYSRIGVVSRSSISMNYWLHLENLPYSSWMRVGRFMPNYGLRLADHTSFIRGGNTNRTKQFFETEGMIITPYISSPVILELGLPLKSSLLWTLSWATPILKNSEEIGNFTTHINYVGGGETLSYLTGISYLQEENVHLIEGYGGIHFKQLSWTGAVSRADNWVDSGISLAVYQEIAYEIIQGLHLLGKYDFFDPSIDVLTGSISRFSLGLDIFPLNILEIKLQARFNQVDSKEYEQKSPELLLQTHFYF
jgi:hypothetical protein